MYVDQYMCFCTEELAEDDHIPPIQGTLHVHTDADDVTFHVHTDTDDVLATHTGTDDITQQHFESQDESLQSHRQVRSSDHFPKSPLERKYMVPLSILTAVVLVAGAVLISVGVLVRGLINFHGMKPDRSAPPLWWTGIMPFLLAMLGSHVISTRKRSNLYWWSVVLLALLLMQTILMGWAGNFSSSQYDAWPPWLINHGNHSVCRENFDHEICYCQNKYQGLYSNLRLPSVNYIYDPVISTMKRKSNMPNTGLHSTNNISAIDLHSNSSSSHQEDQGVVVEGDITTENRTATTGKSFNHDTRTLWRETMFTGCDRVLLVSRLFYTCVGTWGAMLLSAVVICVLVHRSTVCASPAQGEFAQLVEEEEESVLESPQGLKDNCNNLKGDRGHNKPSMMAPMDINSSDC